MLNKVERNRLRAPWLVLAVLLLLTAAAGLALAGRLIYAAW